MTARVAAVRYAGALFDVAQKERLDLERLQRELTAFSDLVKGNADLSRVLATPAIPASRKRAVIEQLVALSPLSAPLARLLMLLAERDRLTLIEQVVQAFRARVMEHRQVIRAEVTTAIALPPDRVSALEQGLARATGRQVHLDTRVESAIIGGAVARIGSTVYDGSVTTQLQRLRQRLTESEL